ARQARAEARESAAPSTKSCVVDRAKRVHARAAALLLLFGDPVGEAAADEFLLPPAVEQNQSIEIVYGLEHPATGQGFLDVEWSDVDGRVIERRRISVDLTKASQVAFSLDAGRAITMKNQLTARFSLESIEQGGGRSRLENSTSKSFI